jgi:hypothetical protein
VYNEMKLDIRVLTLTYHPSQVHCHMHFVSTQTHHQEKQNTASLLHITDHHHTLDKEPLPGDIPGDTSVSVMLSSRCPMKPCLDMELPSLVVPGKLIAS